MGRIGGGAKTLIMKRNILLFLSLFVVAFVQAQEAMQHDKMKLSEILQHIKDSSQHVRKFDAEILHNKRQQKVLIAGCPLKWEQVYG